MQHSLSALDWMICIGYLAIVFTMGLWFARQQHSNEDYFLGGRKMHWLPIGLSLFAGTFSSLSFVGLPSEAAYGDYHLYLAILFIPLIVTPIVWCLFLPLFFRLGLTSPYEYVERRFNRPLRLFASLLFMLYTIGWMGNLLRAVGVILQAVLELSDIETAWLLVGVGLFATLYTSLGGVKAVVWTDALQAFALGGGMLLVLVFAMSKVDGGAAAVWRIGQAHDKFAMFHMDFSLHNTNLYGACAFGFFVYLAGHSVTFTAVQRYVSMPNIAAARRSLVVNGVMVGAVCLLFFFVGSTLFAYYQPGPNSSGVKNVSLSEPVRPTDNLWKKFQQSDEREKQKLPNRQDQLLPRFIMSELAVRGLMGLLLAGLFAAAMSSVDSGINSMTASVVCDWQSEKDVKLWQSRLMCVGFGIAAVIMALTFFFMGGRVFPLIMKIAGMFFGLLLGVFFLGMFVRKAGPGAAMVGLAAGIIGLVFTFALNVSHWWFGAFTFLPTFFVGWLASFVMPPPEEKQVAGLVVGLNWQKAVSKSRRK